MLRSIICLTIIAVTVLSALADVPPPPPEKGFKQVPLEHVVKLGGEIPGYKFYTYHGYIRGGETLSDELKFEKDRGIIVPSTYSGSVQTGVVAVPVKVLEEFKGKENLAPLLNWKNKDKLPAGVVVHQTQGTTMDLPEKDPRTKVEEVITFSADDKAGVKVTVEEPTAMSKKPGGESSSLPPAATMFAGAALSLAFVTSCLLWFRRKSAM